MSTIARALTIAGSDCSGGAGIQADLKTFSAFGVFGMSAVTAVVAENTVGVQAILELPVAIVLKQIGSCVEDIGVDAVKIGMLSSPEIVLAVAGAIRDRSLPNVVVDPVMVAKSGDPLLSETARATVRDHLLPLARVITPNRFEAEALTGRPIRNLDDARAAAAALHASGCGWVVVKGGHLPGLDEAVDVVYDGREHHALRAPLLDTPHTHGTGCTFSSAVAAGLARGMEPLEAITQAKAFITEAIRTAPGLGRGHGPTNHLAGRDEPLVTARRAAQTRRRAGRESTMRAMVIPSYGGPEVFEMRDIECPSPGPGDVLVRVIASGTNPVDAKIRQTGYWADLVLPAVLGYEAAGVVEETGAGVTAFRRGDEVYFAPEIHGNARGTYAEYSVAPASQIALKPRNLSFEEAAAIPLAGGTAWEAVVRRLRLAPGETILIHGGAGGVGSLAVQFARAAGARVIATASASNLGTLRDLGADVALDYGADDVTKRTLEETEGKGADAAFEVQGGGDLVSRCLAAVRPFARIACILPPAGDLRPLYTKNITLYGVFLTREGRRLEEMRRCFERGQARVLIDRVLPLEEVAQAHRRLDSHHGRGKIVLRVAAEPAASARRPLRGRTARDARPRAARSRGST